MRPEGNGVATEGTCPQAGWEEMLTEARGAVGVWDQEHREVSSLTGEARTRGQGERLEEGGHT